MTETDPFVADERRARRIFEEYGADQHWPDFDTCIVCLAHSWLTLKARYDVLVDGAKTTIAQSGSRSEAVS